MTNLRVSPIEVSKQDFKKAGYQLIDVIADFIENIRDMPVTTGESPKQIQNALGTSTLPEEGAPMEEIVMKAANLLINHSLLNGHPKFYGYITSSAAPIGALADLLAAAVNPNVGANILSPVATEIEKQTIRWLAEFIGVSPTYAGILVSGGNMANFTGFLTGRVVKGQKSSKINGISNESQRLMIYCSKATHTWVEKAAVLFGLGTNSIRWIEVDDANIMNVDILERSINEDINNGEQPIMVIGNAGDVSTGAVDTLNVIANIAKKYNLWFHIDGAYGVPAAVIPELKPLFEGIEEADSIALDPHKWLYSPLEAGCTLVKNPKHLHETYSSHPEYYNFGGGEEAVTHNFYEYGLQNSRGFRALKVWSALQQAGRKGYIGMISEDIRLSKLMYEKATKHPELEAITQSLSIATLRYVPQSHNYDEASLNKFNETLLNSLQQGGKVFLSNAVVKGKYCLRACIVNFRTTEKDIEEVIQVITEEGKKIHERQDQLHLA
jgi:aromatic-L-amino-acid/L-tryptophan decarboxylase